MITRLQAKKIKEQESRQKIMDEYRTWYKNECIWNTKHTEECVVDMYVGNDDNYFKKKYITFYYDSVAEGIAEAEKAIKICKETEGFNEVSGIKVKLYYSGQCVLSWCPYEE